MKSHETTPINIETSFAVEIRNLNVKFADFHAVKDVSLSVKKGEIFGFLGANGAGKTTTIRVLCGLLEPTSGIVKVDGESYVKGREIAIKKKVGYMSQKFTLYDDLTVAENLSFTASLRKIPHETFKIQRKRLLEFIGFDRPLDTFVKDLPGGLKQQVSLAASIIHEPAIVFLDEPTAGVTPAARARFWNLIRILKSEGKTIFVTTHYMDEAEYCERIALMRTGELIALDSVEGLKKSAFPEPIFELTPKNGKLSPTEFTKLKNEDAIRSLQPYGIRFHAAVTSRAKFEAIADQLKIKFEIKETKPTLEDVFIELVEGKKRYD